MIENNKSIAEGNEGDIKLDILGVVKDVWNIRKKLIKVGVIAFVVSCVIVLFIPKKYKTMVTLAPESSQTGGGMLSGVASMLGMGSLSMSPDVDALNVDIYPDVVSSTPFMLDILDTPVRMLDNPEEEIPFEEYLEEHTGTALGKIVGLPMKGIKYLKDLMGGEEEEAKKYNEYHLTKERANNIKALREMVATYVSKKTSVTNIEVTTEDPLVTAILTDTIVSKLKESIIKYRIAKAVDDCKYWEGIYEERKNDYFVKQNEYAQYVDANRNLILQKVKVEEERLSNEAMLAYQLYTNVATQLQLVRAKVQEAKPAFAVVEPASVPIRAAGLGRSITVIVMVFITEIFAILWILYGKDMWCKLKSFLKQSREEIIKEEQE